MARNLGISFNPASATCSLVKRQGTSILFRWLTVLFRVAGTFSSASTYHLVNGGKECLPNFQFDRKGKSMIEGDELTGPCYYCLRVVERGQPPPLLRYVSV